MKTNPFYRSLSRLALPALLLTAAACSPGSPKLMAPAEKYQSVTAEGGDFKVDFNPKVDILFVIDNSASMGDDQERLSANIEKFVSSFAKNELIDFHIGIVSTFDSGVQKPEGRYFWPNGQLRPLKDPSAPAPSPIVLPLKGKDGKVLVDKDKKPIVKCTTTDEIVTNTGAKTPGFITRETPEWLKTLQASLKVGVQCLDHGGPEYEEIFSPVAQALSSELMNGANAGFYREDAHLAVILITDTDASNADLTAGQLDSYLRALKGGKKSLVSVHAVANTSDDKKCERDPMLTPQKKDPKTGQVTTTILEPLQLNDLLRSYQSRALNLCDPNYGQKLGEIGQDIRRRTLGRVIRLEAIPATNSEIQVSYGSQIIPQDPEKGWTYDSGTISIVISGDVEVTREEGAQIKVEFTPVKLENLTNGRAVRRQ